MAKIHIIRKHDLGQTEARKRVEKIARSLENKLEAKIFWKGNTLNFKRSGATGTLDVGENHIDCNVKLGMLLTPLKSTIETALNDTIDKAIG